jgi:hypothetical protein
MVGRLDRPYAMDQLPATDLLDVGITAMRVPEARELSEKERVLLEQLLLHGTAESRTYVEQLSRVTVASRCGCGCPTIDLAVADRIAPPGSPTVILSEAGGVSPEGISFGVILHGREGLLSELEVYPIEGDAVFTLPDLDQIEFY